VLPDAEEVGRRLQQVAGEVATPGEAERQREERGEIVKLGPHVIAYVAKTMATSAPKPLQTGSGANIIWFYDLRCLV